MQEKINKKPLIVFLLFCIGDLIALGFEIFLLQAICKTLLVPSLWFFFTKNVKSKSITTNEVQLALLFCTVGDFALLFEKEVQLAFLIGLGSFLIGHIFYVRAFLSIPMLRAENFMSFLSWLFVLYGISLYSFLFFHLDWVMRVAVAIYAMAITGMALTVISRKTTFNTVFPTVFGGVFLFILSDSCIAINKFLQPIPYAQFIIMITYMLAQGLIVYGMIKYFRGILK